MTRNQINYWDLEEKKRSNRAQEIETNRANLAREGETARNNRAVEAETNRSNLAREQETHRANVANEDIKNRTLIETGRHNLATEGLQQQQIGLGYSQLGLGYSQLAEQQRTNQANEQIAASRAATEMQKVAEQQRHNLQTETNASRQTLISGLETQTKINSMSANMLTGLAGSALRVAQRYIF